MRKLEGGRCSLALHVISEQTRVRLCFVQNLTFIVSLSTLVQILVRHACEPIREHLDLEIASYG